MYVRLCETINNVGKLVPTTDIAKFIENQEKDYYSSIFLYNEDQKRKAEELIEVTKDGKTFKRPKGVSGIKEVVTNKLVFDFDSDNLQNAKLDTIELIQRLEGHGVNSQDLNICFSGSKGFSVELNTKERFSPEEFKGIVHALALDLKTFDPKIVDPNRIFRLPFTKHPKTGLYKTPLSKDELEGLSIDEIKDLAKEPIKVDAQYLSHTTEVPESIKKLKVVKRQEAATVPSEGTFDLDLSSKPSWLSNWKYALSRGFFKEGTRSYALTILGATCRNQFMSKTQAYYFLKAAADEQVQRFGGSKFEKDEIWRNIIEVVYGANWQGGSWSEENFPEDLKQFLLQNGIPKEGNETLPELIETVHDGFGEFITYAKEIEKNTIKFGIPSIDKNLKIRKGHSIGLIAPPGVGKTSFAITMINNMSKEGSHIYFASYDMYKNNVYQKLIQRHTGLKDDDIYKVFINNDKTKIEEFRQILSDNYGNVTFCFKNGQSIAQLKASIKLSEQKTGKKIDLVVVDYIELILSEKSDPTAASAEAAQGLREIANEGRVVLILLQPNKLSSKPNEPLTSYNSAKGSSAIAQSVTTMLTLHRPGLHSRLQNEDNFIGLDCVKNRNGGLFSLDFYWDGKTQTFSEIDEVGRVRLENVRRLVRDLDNAEEEEW
jgi:KaiC/GvpD/RAD55 family RecA-like ATPase